MKTLWKRFACLAVALITPAMLSGCDKKQPAQGVCYRITGGKNPMVILGSIHVGSPEMEPYGQHILDEMDAADVFVFECDSDAPEAAAAAAALMAQTDGVLQDQLSGEAWQLLTEACDQAGLRLSDLNGLKPWAVTSMLTTRAAAGQMGARNARQAISRGVEDEVLAHVDGRDIRYLETAVAQLELLNGFSPALQEALLMQSCQAVIAPEESSSLADWPLWWRDGDTEAFAREYANDESLPPTLIQEYHSALVTGRNQAMADALCAMLEDEEAHRYFVTVGLMHLVLPQDSILWELEQRGYTVERLWLENE